MNATKVLLIYIFFILTLYSCNTGPEKPLFGNFWAYSDISGDYYRIDAAKTYESSNCIIYIDKNLDVDTLTPTSQYYGELFTTNIYKVCTNAFGNPPDVDNNNKVIILFLDIKSYPDTSDSYVAGYFDPNNELLVEHSNEKDMIFMDANQGLSGINGVTNFPTTLAHEFQHMINYNQNVFIEGGSEQDVWINEGLSTAAESLYLKAPIANKLTYYTNDSSHTFANGKSLFKWSSYFSSYVNTYLFFQWIREQAVNSNLIYKEIITNSTQDSTSVLSRLQSRISVYDGSTTWSIVLRDWYLAKFLNKASGLYGFKNYFGSFTSPYLNYTQIYTNTQYALEPGAGIIINPGSNPTTIYTNSSKISYFGFDTATPTIYSSGFSFSGDYLLILNSDNSTTATALNSTNLPVYASVISPSAGSAKGVGLKPLSESASEPIYPVDFIIKSKR